MIFKQLNPGDCRTYLIASEKTREAALVDPLLERLPSLLELLRQERLKPRWILDTHTHADHVSAGARLSRDLDIDYLMHASSRVRGVSRKLEDGQELGLGDLRLLCRHVPGHTPDSLLLLCGENILSGDFLFLGEAGAGRLDLPGGDANAHYESLRLLDALPGASLVHPAHDYAGKAFSSLEAERRVNPVLSTRTREEYLRWWESRKLGPADWMKAVVAANLSGPLEMPELPIPTGGGACLARACAPATASEVAEWTPRELRERLDAAEPLFLLDVREHEEYEGELGAIPGSRLIPLGELPKRIGEVPKDKTVVAICKSGGRSARAAAVLLKAGYARVVSLRGGMEEWVDSRPPA